MSEQEEQFLAATVAESAGIPRKRDERANDSESSEVNLLKRQIRYANQNIEFLQGYHQLFSNFSPNAEKSVVTKY